MDADTLRALLAQVHAGTVSPDAALERLRRLPFADLAHSRIDHHRQLRTGHAEAVYAPNKQPAECVEIVAELLDGGTGPVVVSRADAAQTAALTSAHRGATVTDGTPATLVWRARAPRTERVVIASGGTADGPVAREAHAVLAAHGVCAELIADVGVAGLQRFLACLDAFAEADAVVAVAGMEGALATAVAGVTPAPVVAVPTSTGYGAGLDGVTALLAMHASCAAGVSVVGIDNGFGAAMAVMRILDRFGTTASPAGEAA